MKRKIRGKSVNEIEWLSWNYNCRRPGKIVVVEQPYSSFSDNYQLHVVKKGDYFIIN